MKPSKEQLQEITNQEFGKITIDQAKYDEAIKQLNNKRLKIAYNGSK